MMFMEKASRKLSEEEVEHIAWLARIELSDSEKLLFTRQFNIILENFRVLDEVNSRGVKPILHILNLTNIFRKDIVEDSMPIDLALANAPRKEKGYFKAPKIV